MKALRRFVVFLIAVAFLLVGFSLGKNYQNAEIEAAKKAVGQKEELKQINKTAETFQTLKKFQRSLNETSLSGAENSKLVKLLRDLQESAFKAKMDEDLIPAIDNALLTVRGEDYLAEYLDNLDELLNQYKYCFNLNLIAKLKLEGIKSTDAKNVKKVKKLKKRVLKNLEFWDIVT